MHIAMVHWGYPPVIGGVETHLSLLGPALAQKGHTVSLLTGAHADSRSSFVDRGMRVQRLPIMDLNWLYRRGLANLEGELRKSVRSFLERSQADIVHAHNMHYFSELHARVLETEARRKEIPILLTAHNVWTDSLCARLTRDVKWDHIIAVSGFIKRALEGYGLERNRITTIHHGIEGRPFFTASPKSAYARYPVLKNKRVVFHPARMGLAKGSDVVVQAFRSILEEVPSAFLVLAGTKNTIDWGETQEKDIAYVLELLDIFNLREHTLIDQYALKLMPAMYAASEVVVYPSTSPEPFGVAMLEAYAAAKPLIVARSGGMPEVVRHGVSGYIVDPWDHRALARTAIRLLKNRAQARTIGKQGKAEFKSRYVLPVMVEKTLDVYKDCTEDRRA